MSKNAGLVACVGLAAASLLAASGVGAAPAKRKVYLKEEPPKESDLGFRIPRSQLLSTIKRVGLIRVALPVEMGVRVDAQQAIRDSLARYLTRAGMEVVSTGDYDKRLAELEKLAGGFYDPNTGELKTAEAQAAQATARREFAANEKLDGFVIPIVVPTAAQFFGRNSRWDNVEDRSAGPADAALSGGWSWLNGARQGSLSAVSLQLQVVTPDGRTVFDRRGGIQLTVYVPAKSEAQSFSRVRPQDLLRDPTRIDRAAQVVTMPLIHSPVDIVRRGADPEIDATRIDLQTLGTLPAGSDARDDPDASMLVSREQILKSVHRVAVSSLSSDAINVPGWLDGRLDPHIKAELGRLGWEVIEAPDARDVLAAQLIVEKPFDPFTGKADATRLREARKATLHALQIQPLPDAILWVGLERREAIHQNGIADWDGVSQNGFTLKAEAESPWLQLLRGNGDADTAASLPALSLSVTLTDATGASLYRSAGGFHLLQRLKARGNRLERINLTSAQVFRNRARDEIAVHAAFRDLILTPAELAGPH